MGPRQRKRERPSRSLHVMGHFRRNGDYRGFGVITARNWRLRGLGG